LAWLDILGTKISREGKRTKIERGKAESGTSAREREKKRERKKFRGRNFIPMFKKSNFQVKFEVMIRGRQIRKKIQKIV
jgi:hypothetical protein